MAKLTTLSYGGTAAIVTGMGLVVAFDAGTTSKATLISSLLVVAIADNLADSLAIHVYHPVTTGVSMDRHTSSRKIDIHHPGRIP